MAEGEDQEKKDLKKGFAGLSSLISDVDGTFAPTSRESKSAQKAGAGPEHIERARLTDDQEPEPEQPRYKPPAHSSGGSPIGKWLIAIGMIVGLLWFVSRSGDKASSPMPKASPGSESTAAASPNPSWQAAASPPQASPPIAPSRPTEERPPIGTNNVLTSAQLRYCVAEDIRLDAAKRAINNYNDTHVVRFNQMVADYNGRCGHFRYRNGALESARTDVDRFRTELEAEGRAWFVAAESALPKNGSVTKSESAVSRDPSSLTADERDSIESACSTQKILDGPAAYKACVSSKLRALQSQGARPDLSKLDPEARDSIESACSTQRILDGPAAYNACALAKLRALKSQGTRPDLSQLSSEDRDSIEMACSTQKILEGPAAFDACVTSKLRALRSQGARPDLSLLTSEERESIESACSTKRILDGPAAYNACISSKLRALKHAQTSRL